ncbi:MAG TPA: helix-turn-helix domain-containing protein [Mycobacteriales bacterium]|jgi:tRNA-binding EMAP/Myf-like protein/transcriptional regulator with XRE-family HTH domain|nr:helix-turn-helix domain-containing protein [Mycobacteriales bacterium]
MSCDPAANTWGGWEEEVAVYVAQEILFARVLRQLIAERYGHPAELAEAADLSAVALSRYLDGEISLGVDVLTRLATALGVSLDHLVFGQEAARRVLDGDHSAHKAWGDAGGILNPTDAALVERHSVHTTIVTEDLSTDVLVLEQEGRVAGSPSIFTPVVTENITDGRRYEYFVPQGPSWGYEANLLRKVVTRMGGLKPAFVDRHLQVMHVTNTRFPGFVLYQMPIDSLQQGVPGIFDRVLPFMHRSSAARGTGFIATVEPANSTYSDFALVSREKVPRLIEELHTIRENVGQYRQARGAVVAKVIEVHPHSRAERIHVALIDLGDHYLRQVVFGGSRMLRPGDLVPAAPPGTLLPGGVKMRQRRYRGRSSFGMLCSTDELGWTSGGPNEVAVLNPELEPGQSLDDVDHRAALQEPASDS